MNRIATLSLVLSAALTASCAKDAPQSKRSNLESPAEQAQAPDLGTQETDDEVRERFSHTKYPDKPVSNTGTLGKARGGTLIAAAGEAKLDITTAWADGPAVVIFYRGHW